MNNLENIVTDQIPYPENCNKNRNITFTNAIKHKITTTDDVPVFTKSYRYPYCHKDEVRLQIEKMLDQGVIRPSTSPWSSPIWIVPKKLDASGPKKNGDW